MDPSHAYRAQRFGQKPGPERDAVIVERALELSINGDVFTVLMHTPGMERELAIGLLLNEGLLKAGELPDVKFSEGKGQDHVDVVMDIDPSKVINKRSLLSATSCGICGTRELNIPKGDKLGDAAFDTAQVQNMYTALSDGQDLFKTTGGCHAAALFSPSGQLISLAEDAGRHNATDKAIGAAALSGRLPQAHYLLLSGRVSYELVSKAFKARIPVVCSVSAATSMAVDFALEWGITLLVFCRGERSTRLA